VTRVGDQGVSGQHDNQVGEGQVEMRFSVKNFAEMGTNVGPIEGGLFI
jgi:hypothetical protein